MSLRTARFHQFTRGQSIEGPAPVVVDNIGNPVPITTDVYSISMTATHATPAGNSIIVSVAINGGPDLVVTDTAGNKYRLDNTVLSGVTTSVHVLSAHNVNALPVGGVITVEFFGFSNGSTQPQLRNRGTMQAYDIANLSGEIEDVSAGTSNTDQTNIQQGTVRTTSGNPLYFAAYGVISNNAVLTFTPEVGYTSLAYSKGGTSSSTRDLHTAWQTRVNYGYRTANATISAAKRYAAVTIAYKARHIGYGVDGDGPMPVPQTRSISTADQLITALNLANTGDTLEVAAGTYLGSFKSPGRRGTQSQPITMTLAPGVIFDGNGERGYGLWLYKCQYWYVNGPGVIQNNLKGIIMDISYNCTIDGLTVQAILQEGIHIRNESCDNTIQNCTVQDVGLETPGFGEALYVGSAYSNWGSPVDRASRMPEQQIGFPDKCDRNSFIGNTLRRFPAEAVDVKEGTTGTIIQNNIIDGAELSGANGAEQWIDIKGQGCIVSGNQCVSTLRYGMATELEDPPVQFISPYVDGFGLLQPGIKMGCDNIFSNNTMDCGVTAEYAIAIKFAENTGNVVNLDNVVIGSTPLTNGAPLATAP